MLRPLTLACALVLTLGLMTEVRAQEEGETFLPPAVGDAAPNFELVGSDGKTYTLAQFKDQKPVILAFFPKAFTGG